MELRKAEEAEELRRQATWRGLSPWTRQCSVAELSRFTASRVTDSKKRGPAAHDKEKSSRDNFNNNNNSKNNNIYNNRPAAPLKVTPCRSNNSNNSNSNNHNNKSNNYSTTIDDKNRGPAAHLQCKT